MSGALRAIACTALLLAPSDTWAAPACHCFRERAFDPAAPRASDPYLLATASNTLLATVAGIPKREIVQARMSGTPGEDIWIAAHAAGRWGRNARELIRARAAQASWREALRVGGANLEALGPRFVAALASGGTDSELARIAVAETLAARLGTPWSELDALGAAGASYQETIVAALIGYWARTPAPEAYAAAGAGSEGWSGQLAALGKFPEQMDVEVPRALRLRVP